MSVLGPEDEALVRDARAGMDATPDDQARVKRKLFAQLGIGAAIGGSAIATSSGASASAGAAATTVAAGSSVVAKLLITIAVIGLVGGGAVVVRRSRTHSDVSSSSVAQASANPQQPTFAIEPSVASSASPIAPLDTAQPSQPATPMISDIPTHRSPSRASDPSAVSDRSADPEASTHTTNPDPPTSVPVSGPATVDAEAALLRSADTELKAGRADHALALVDQHAAQFPNGVLTEEREAERIVVLCALGRNQEAREAATTFLTARPRSPQTARIRASCGGK
jgi:hypothetical protein